ncbi:MAG: glutaminyl-peptide cyclotransferase [Acidimicrobiales bacterium]
MERRLPRVIAVLLLVVAVATAGSLTWWRTLSAPPSDGPDVDGAADRGSDRGLDDTADGVADGPGGETGPTRLTGRWTAVATARHPHDPEAFTQGLEVIDDGRMLESTGLLGASTVRIVDIETGEVERLRPIGADRFGEGVTVVGDRILQLTWTNGELVVSDLATLAEVNVVAYDGEGWGLCHDGDRLVMSDGSATLTFRHPETFEATGSVEVTIDGRPLERLNELECIGDQVWANVLMTDDIAVIDPATGSVEATVDASALAAEMDDPADVLNGIAYDDRHDILYLTGKRWDVLYEVRLVPADDP